MEVAVKNRWQLTKSNWFAFNAVLLTIVVVSMALWVYEVGVSYFVPQYLSVPLSHYDFFPLNIQNDTVGIVSFAIWVVSLFLWFMLFNPIKVKKRPGF